MLKHIRTFLHTFKADLQRRADYNKLMKIAREVSGRAEIRVGENETDTRRPLIISGIGMEKIGMFAAMQAVIRWISYAEKMGYAPIVDMKYVPNLYLEPEELGKKNAWELYFENISEISLERAYAAKDKLVVNRLDIPPFFSKKEREVFASVYTSPDIVYGEERSYWRGLWKKYIRFNGSTGKFIEEEWSAKINTDDKVLGVMLRGSDYAALRPAGHKVQPTFEQMKTKIDEVLNFKQCDKIFVATEDKGYLERFKEEYGKKLCYIESARVDIKQGELVADAYDRMEVDKKENGLQYVAAIAMLSKCNYLIASKTSATEFIYLMKDGDYEYDHVFELGDY